MNEWKKISSRGVLVIAAWVASLCLAFVAGVAIDTWTSGGDKGGDAGIAERYTAIATGFAEQQKLLGEQQAILERVRGEVDAANGIIDRAIATSGRAAERIQDIIEKMDALIACIRNIDNAITGRDSSNGGE